MMSGAAIETTLKEQRHLFDVSDEVAYFNTASMSPLLGSVRQAGERGLARRAAPWTIAAPDWFSDVEQVRSLFAQVINASPEGVALIPATSYGLGVAARNLRATPGQRVLILHEEYPSSYYTWQKFAARTETELVAIRRERGQSWIEALLGALDERVAAVVAVNVHWTNGALVDLATLAPRVRALGAALIIDASQSAGALPIDVATLRPDFLVSVGYKWLLGPFGIGYLYVDERHREGEPLEENWTSRRDSEDFARLVNYQDAYRAGARRFDMGARSNFGLLPMAIAALQQLLDWGIGNIAAGLGALTTAIADRAALLGIEVPPADTRGPHMLGFDLPGKRADKVGAALADAGVIVSVRGSALRVAPHLHVTDADVERFATALGGAL